MAAVPTTAGTGSEATRFTVITDTATDIKMLLNGAPLIPDLAIIDPAYTVSSPKGITAATGLDALTHAIESYTNRKAQPLTDTVAISAVKRIFKYLPIAYKDGENLRAREEMSVAAFSDDDKSAAELLIKAIGELCRLCEIPTFEEYGIPREKFFAVLDKMAADAVASGSPANTVKAVTVDDVKEIYRGLWK